MKLTQRPIEWELGIKREEEEIDGLEKQFQEQRADIQRKKVDLERKKGNDWEWEERKLKERLKELQQETLENTDFIDSTKKRIAEFRYREHQVQQRQLEAEDELIKAIRLNQLDNIVQKKLELERLEAKKNDLEEKELRENMYLQAITEEQERRDFQNVNNLEKILHKAQYIEEAIRRGDLDKKNQAMLAQNLQEGGNFSEKQRKQIVDEITAKREREKQQFVLDKEAQIQKLNEERWGLLQDHEALLKKRIVHDRLAERGVDFLAALELGRGPPREMLVNNLGDVEVDLEDVDKPMNEIIESVTTGLETLNDRITLLKEERNRTLRQIEWMNRPYKGEADVRKLRPDLSLDIYVPMKELVYDLIEYSWGKLQEYQEYLDEIMRRKEYFEHKSEVLKEKIEYQLQSSLQGLLTNLLIEEALDKFLGGIVEEVHSIARFSQSIIVSFIGSGIKRQREVPQSEQEIAEMIEELLNIE